MKAISKALVAMILLMASFPVLSANEKVGPTLGSAMILYQVNIHVTASTPVPFNGDHYFVVITDEKGKLVAPVQLFNINKHTYTFSETGPVSGTRVAGLMPDPDADGGSIRNLLAPDAKTGVFVPGSIYIFNLWPDTTRTR